MLLEPTNDALTFLQARFSFDEYIQEKRVRSLLCIPMLKEDELQGVVYLENNSFSGAFLPARVAVLCVLVSYDHYYFHLALRSGVTTGDQHRERVDGVQASGVFAGT